MTVMPVIAAPSLEDEVAELALRCRAANSGAMRAVNVVSGVVESRLNALLAGRREKIEAVVVAKLTQVYDLAAEGGRIGSLGRRGSTVLSAASGAIGGFFGFAGALVELPVSIGIILNAIQDVAKSQGFNVNDDAIRAEVLEVFASGGPVQEDDGVNTAFLTARLTLGALPLHTGIAQAATRIASQLAPRLGAKAVPVLGALVGAGLNAAYTNYYHEMAHIHFARLRLIERYGEDVVIAAFNAALAQPRLQA